MGADLHCHTRISDGSISLDDLILLAKKRRISTIAVTDHDTLAGVTRAKILGDRFGVNVIPGVEFSCYDYKNGKKVHLLAYLFSYPNRLEGLCKRTGEARKKASMQMISKVLRYYPITPEMVARIATGSTNIFRQHIMHSLMNAGYSTTVFGELFDKLFDPQTGICRVEPEYPDVFEVLELLNSAGAISVLAHPTYYGNMDILPELIEKGLHGVEAWHPRNTQEDTDMLLKIAEEHKLITTGGSDFHGMYAKKPIPLGMCTTPDECLQAMISLKDKLSKGQ
ncbi:MAG: PHP domain-containing protein [Clostridia bacterium]|nr:PHP domain-containing protein [Clostridia bacterium]